MAQASTTVLNLNLGMTYVAAIQRHVHRWCLTALLGGVLALDLVLSSSWGPGTRYQVGGQHSFNGGVRFVAGDSSTFRQADHRDRGDPTGIGVQSLPQIESHGDGPQLGGLEGSRPVGGGNKDFHIYQFGGNILDEHFYIGKENEIRKCPRTRRRERVCDRSRGQQSNLLQQVCGEDRRATSRCRGSFDRTDQRGGEEGLHSQTTSLLRLQRVCAVCKKASTSTEISILPTTRRRQFPFEDGARARKFWSLASEFSSDEDHIHYDRSHKSEQPYAMGGPHREVEPAVPELLGPHRSSRRSWERRVHEQIAGTDEDGIRLGQHSTARLEPRQPVGLGLDKDTEGQGLLERASLHACSHLDSTGCEGKTSYSDGRRSQCWIARRPSSTTWRGRGPPGESEEENEQSEKGSKEEEMESRKRRVGAIEKQQEERRKGWRWKGLQRKRWKSRGGVLRLEQWEWTMRRTTSWRKVQRKSSTATQMHDLQVSRASFKRMHPEAEQDLNFVKLLFYRIWTHGEGEEVKHEPKEESKQDNPDRSGIKRNLDEKRGTKRKLHAGEDPPEDEDPKPGKVHYGGDFLNFEEFLQERTFLFVHHFSGKVDRLSKAVEEECEKLGIKVHAESADLENGVDLATTTPYAGHLEYARQGRIDGFHAGFPCNTYTKLRWRPAKDMPGPLRSKSFPYGFPDLSEAKKKECDQGTLFMARSANVVRAMYEADREVKVPSFATLENPPPSHHEEHISAWHMPELVKLLEDIPEWQSAYFHTCGFEEELEVGARHFKPQLMGGTLPGLQTLRRGCPCGERPHEPIVGKEKSKKSAEYPKALCREYGKLAAKHFMRIAKSEFLEGRAKVVEGSISKLRAKRTRLEEETEVVEKKTKEIQETEDYKRAMLAASSSSTSSLVWKEGKGKFGMMKEMPKKAEMPPALVHIGGMRDPHKAALGLPTLQNLGQKIWRTWEAFVARHPSALEIAETYGTKECKANETLVKEWNSELRGILELTEAPSVILKAKDEYRTPIDTELLGRWVDRAGDPETAVPRWLVEGAPLGIEIPIETCGIFPKMEEQEKIYVSTWDSDAALEKDIKNYVSFEEAIADAKIEIERYKDLKFLKKLDREANKDMLKGGTVSKLGLIVKVKDSGETKRRVIIDLRRSGGNSKSSLPEKLILPRPVDATRMMKSIREKENLAEKKDPTWSTELAVVDISDAFTVLPVAEVERKHCLTPGIEENVIYQFQALLFGFKVAPLLYSRFAALVARLLAGMITLEKGGHQVYLDDSLWMLQGSLKKRSTTLAAILMTMLALGAKLSLGKGCRSRSVDWIGVKFTLVDEDTAVLSLPERFLEEMGQLLSSWEGKGYAATKELRKAAGKAAWLAGILPRAKWVTAVLYSVLTQTLKEEAETSGGRRERKGLFAVKRLELARLWMIQFLAVAKERPTRRIDLRPKTSVEVRLMTDASPEGLGGALAINERIIEVFSCAVTKETTDALIVEYMSSASQAVLETLAILVALRKWINKFKGYKIEIAVQSDSTAALAVSQKLAGRSNSPGLNFLGAELGLCLEETAVEGMRAIHIPGKANLEPDYLSRPSSWKTTKLPEGLEGLEIKTEQGPVGDFYRLPTPKDAPSLWGVKGAATGGSTLWEAVQ